MGDLSQQLAELGPDRLADLLRRRPDALARPTPRTLPELADRLESTVSVGRALLSTTVAHLQVIAAALALGPQVPIEALARLLDGDPRAQLADLADLCLLAVRPGDVVVVGGGVRLAVPDLLRLGEPFHEIAVRVPHRLLQDVERAVGLPRSTSKRAAVAALAEYYADPDRIRRQLDGLPAPVATELVRRAWGLGTADGDIGFDGDFGFDRDFGFDGDIGFDRDIGYDENRWQLGRDADRMGLDAGLLIGEVGYWGARPWLPAEVALALRGPDYRVPFDPEPPTVVALPVARLDADVHAAVAAFDAAATAVLDHVAGRPLAVVQAGGVGTREIARVAKVVRAPEITVRVVLELAAAAGLLTRGRTVAVSDGFAAWREAEPAERYVLLARTWWTFPGRPSRDREPDGTARRALAGAGCEPCRLALAALLDVLAADHGVAADQAAALAAWWHPGVHAGSPPFAAVWAEAELLGAVAQGARTAVGTALVAGDVDALRAAVAGALPASTSEAVFGSDLTAFVAGSPASGVSRVLDACADRESGGGAVTWRLSPGSVRRALDDGWTVAGLRESLAAVCAGGPLPQAVTVLLDDVARQHGRLRVGDAVSVIVADDVALAAQVQHDRKLASLGFRAVTPTVLVSSTPGQAVVAALRKAGYMPAWDGADAGDPVVLARAPAGRAGSPSPPSSSSEAPRVPSRRGAIPAPAADPDVLARALLAAPATAALTPTEHDVRQWARTLSDDEIHVLAEAIDARRPVEIVYESSTGGVTERAITPQVYVGGRIWAWCALRSDDREFVVDRVLAVRPV